MAQIFAAVAGAISNVATSQYAADKQNKAAKLSGKQAEEAGLQGAEEIARGNADALRYAQQGQTGALGQYDTAQRYAEAQRAGLMGMYQPARQLGSQALNRYQSAILGGDQSGVYRDPAFALRQQAAMNSAQRLAQSAGMGGDMRAMGGIGRYNQAYGGQEYRNALARLQTLSSMGSQATQNYANVDQAAMQGLGRIGGARAGLYGQAGEYNAELTKNAAIAAANARQNLASNLSQYQIQAQNALLQGHANTVSAGQQGAANMLYGIQSRG